MTKSGWQACTLFAISAIIVSNGCWYYRYRLLQSETPTPSTAPTLIPESVTPVDREPYDWQAVEAATAAAQQPVHVEGEKCYSGRRIAKIDGVYRTLPGTCR